MNDLKKAEIKDKKIFLRCDFNVSIDEDGNVVDDFRIQKTIPTIDFLVEKGAKVILATHRGRPEKQRSFKGEGVFFGMRKKVIAFEKEYSLEPVYNHLKKHLRNVSFSEDCVGPKVKEDIDNLKSGEILLLENLRYYKEEESCGKKFSKELASYADIYVNDAFSCSHRSHASIVGVPKHLPAYAGLLFREEVESLARVKDDPKRPLVVIVGGSKISSKMDTIKYFMEQADHILLGGKVANTVLTVNGLAPNKELPDKEIIEKVEKNIEMTDSNIHLPVDVITACGKGGKEYVREAGPAEVRSEEDIFDIGPETIKIYKDIIRRARTIVWAGPLGFFEKKEFEIGTKKIAEKVVENQRAFKILGGGDTSLAFEKFNLRYKIDHVSTGGGAMLQFFSGGEMPGLEALKKDND